MLKDFSQFMDLQAILKIARGIANGMEYLHQRFGLVHRDLKLENILVNDSVTCKLTDFGNIDK
jgi:serine/threonine protein kinase